MNSISACIDSLIAIDDQVFLAECDVMLANDIWLNKMSDMIKYSGNSDSMIGYIQEADYGRRDTGGNQWLSKLRIFILKCIDKIVDAITNFLLKIKTREADYIRIPYKYEDLMEDINLVKSIDKEIYQIFDNVENFASADNVKKLANIKEKLRNTHFAKNQRFMISDKDPEAHNKLNKYGIKPDQYMKLAKELRELNRAFKDTKTRASKMVQKEWLKDPSSTDKSRVAVQEFLFNIYAEMSKMIVKLMQSFTVSGVEKMNQEVIEKKIVSIKTGIINLQKIIDESVEHDIDDDELEFFDETEKPFDDYLKKHNYDHNTNTVEIDGARHNVGKIPSKKERNRINRFLRENNYDPKTETIQTDMKNKDGSNKRIKFNMIMDNSSTTGPAYYFNPEVNPEINPDLKETSINIKSNILGTKPKASNQIFKHEEGHANQVEEGKGGRTTNIFGDEYGYLHSSDENKKDIEKFQSQEGKNVESDSEHDADLYGYQHNPYAKELTKDIISPVKDTSFNDMRRTNMNRAKQGRREALKDVNALDAGRDMIRTDIVRTRMILKTLYKDIKEIRYMLQQDDNYIKTNTFNNNSRELLLKDLNTNINDIPILKDKLDDYEKELRKLDGDKGLTEYKKSERYEKYKTSVKNDVNDFIEQLNTIIKRATDVFNIRGEYLSQHADEAGSKARKLEGRQGKHKGKK